MAVENICPVDFVMTGVIVKAQECDATDVAYRSGACDKRKEYYSSFNAALSLL